MNKKVFNFFDILESQEKIDFFLNDDCIENPCLNNATCFTLLNGGVYCSCPTGYTGKYWDEPCKNGGKCEDTVYCSCLTGFTGKYCQDIVLENNFDKKNEQPGK